MDGVAALEARGVALARVSRCRCGGRDRDCLRNRRRRSRLTPTSHVGVRCGDRKNGEGRENVEEHGGKARKHLDERSGGLSYGTRRLDLRISPLGREYLYTFYETAVLMDDSKPLTASNQVAGCKYREESWSKCGCTICKMVRG